MSYLRNSKACLLCGLLLAAVACSKTQPENNANGGGASSTTTTTSTAVGGANPRAELTAAVRAQLGAQSYRAQMQSSTSNGMTSTTVIEYVAPDRYHMTQDAQLPGGNTFKQETLIVGKDTWMRRQGGAWQKFPVDVGQIVAQFRDPKMLDELAKSSDIKFVGPDTVDGAPALVYEYTLTGELAKNFKGTARTWIGATDNLPRKTESEGEMEFMGKPLKTKTTITYSDYNASIQIEPPK